MAVMSFLVGIGSEYNLVTTQIISSAGIPSLNRAFTRILHSEVTSFTPAVSASTAFVSHNTGCDFSYKGPNRGGNPDKKSLDVGGRGIMCYYCREPGHTKRSHHKLHNKSQKTRSTLAATTDNPPPSSDTKYTLSAEECVKY